MSKYLPLNLFIRQALLYPLTAPFLPGVANVKKDINYAAGKLIGTYECPAAGGIPFTGQVTLRVPNDDGDYQKGLTVTRPIVKGAVGNTRFVDNGDGTITDSATGLMWVKDPINNPGAPFDGVANWATAITNCEALNFAEHTDWRLPNVKELQSIIDYGADSPAIDAGIFPNTKLGVTSWYWTSTTVFVATTLAWRILFGNPGGGEVNYENKNNTNYVRPVRLGLP